MNKRVAIVVGHTQESKGAYSPFGLPMEWDFNKEVASCFDGYDDGDLVFDVYYYSPRFTGYMTRINALAERINRFDYDLVLELHYNSAQSSQANGCEVLYYFNSRKGKAWARLFSDVISEGFGVKNRGIKALYSIEQRGFGTVSKFKAPTLLLEPFFGSNALDCEKFAGQYYKYFTVLKGACLKAFSTLK